MSYLLCPLLGQEEPLVPAPPAEHVTVGHVLALLAPGRGVVERGVPVLEAGLQQAVPVLLLQTTTQLNSWVSLIACGAGRWMFPRLGCVPD